MAKRALVPIADGTEEIEAVCDIDTLRRANVDVTVASVMGRLQVTAARETKLVADVLIEDCASEVYDLVALPGGIPGAEHLRDSEVLTAILRAQAGAGKLYGAICAAPAVALHTHGLLSGYRATAFPAYIAELEQAAGVEASEDRVVVDRNVITSRGAGTALEFALALVEALFDADKADAVAERMLARR